ncbi:MAG: glycosyltransferase [Erysipelotrichaceae bacterium]
MCNDKVSIIMGIHNGKNRVDKAIESIIKQTYTNWQFVICDDGSTDGSFEYLMSKYGKDDKFILIQNNENKGLAETLNHCIQYCDGEFIARMDDDDYSYSNRFDKQVDFLRNHVEISFVSSAIDIFNGKEITGRRAHMEYPSKNDLIWNTRFIHPATMFKANDLKSVGGYRVSKETVRGQDYDLFMRMYGAGFKGANIQVTLFRYTEDENNIKRRTFKARVGEFKIRCYGYKKMEVMAYAFPFLLKPFVAHFFCLLKNRG